MQHFTLIPLDNYNDNERHEPEGLWRSSFLFSAKFNACLKVICYNKLSTKPLYSLSFSLIFQKECFKESGGYYERKISFYKFHYDFTYHDSLSLLRQFQN